MEGFFMPDNKFKQSWVRISQNDSKMTDLRCLEDSKGKVVKVFDWDGNELKLNAEARCVFYNGQYWRY
jgi:hypothetical protein